MTLSVVEALCAGAGAELFVALLLFADIFASSASATSLIWSSSGGGKMEVLRSST